MVNTFFDKYYVQYLQNHFICSCKSIRKKKKKKRTPYIQQLTDKSSYDLMEILISSTATNAPPTTKTVTTPAMPTTRPIVTTQGPTTGM